MQLLKEVIASSWSALVIVSLLAGLVGMIRWGFGPGRHHQGGPR